MSLIERSTVLAAFLIAPSLCSCARTDSAEISRLKSELESVRARAAAEKAKDVRSAGVVDESASDEAAKLIDAAASQRAKRTGGGIVEFTNGKSRKFTAISGIRGTQKPDLSWNYEKLPSEMFLSTVDRGDLTIHFDKIARINFKETESTSNGDAEVIPVSGDVQSFHFWVLSSLLDVVWDDSIATERIHLIGISKIEFDE